MCLVKHESNFVYDVMPTNQNGSKDYGIFQFNNNYSCRKPGGTSSTICWRINTFDCANTCNCKITKVSEFKMHCLCPILLVFALVGYSYGATKTKCQVVQALRNQGVPDSDLRNSFTDSDISNDANCAVRVKNCAGFGRWYGWKDHCFNVQGSEYDYSSC
ncbi:LYZ [Mytilus coruscus]|uniref:lysozyme n=1 Tax=Mytilus coruscus TaxID=42192 RepID=A0A6J8BV18_MYTCO|nr:LYZ [Mytilus coruscus]